MTPSSHLQSPSGASARHPAPAADAAGPFGGRLEERRRLQMAERLAGLGYWEGDLLTGRIWWSAETWRIFGLAPREQGLVLEELLGLVHPEDRARFSAAIAAGLRGDDACELEYRVVRPGGEVRHVHAREEVTRDDTGRPIRFFGVLQDITERKRTEAALRASEREFRTLAEHTPDFIVRWDRELRRVYVNPAFAAAMDSPPEELTGARLGCYPAGAPAEPPPAVRALRTAVERVFATGEPAEQLLPWRAAGREMLLHLRLMPECDGAREPVTVLAIGRDLTALKRAEEELRALTENSPDFIARVDRGHRYLYVNRVVERLTGRPPEAHLGRRVGEIFAETQPGRSEAELVALHRAVDRVFATGRPVDLDAAAPLPGGGEIVLEGRFVPEFTPDRTVATVLLLARDVTARRQAETALRDSEQAYAGLVNTIDGIVWEADATTFRFSFVSPQAGRLLGYATACWLKEPDFWARHIHPEDRARAMDYCLTCTRDGRNHEFEYRMLAADGRTVWLHDLVTFVPAEGGRPARLRGLMVDITARKQVEQALRESEQRFRQVAEAIDEIFWLDDAATGAVIYESPAYEKIWGRPCASLQAAPHAWLEAVHPDDRARVAALVEQRTVCGYDTEYRIIRPDGSLRHIHEKAFPVRDKQGKVFRVAGVAEDITARRELAEQLRQSQKLEAVGRLAGGVAHDFNNLLTAIQLQTELLRAEPSAGPVWDEGLGSIQEVSRRAAALTRQLLTFSRRQAKEARPLALRDVFNGMQRLIEPLLGENVRLGRQTPSDLPEVHADRGMMEQVLMNLLVNARDALPEDGGTIDVSLATVEITAADVRPLARPGRFVCLAVADTGCGIPPENLARIFEPFYTTKASGKGTGLGLATAYGIVREHQGWIEVESEVGRGTVFRVYLPALDQPVRSPAAAPPPPALPRGREAILLVEDQPQVSLPTQALLRRLGYQVSAAASGAEALRVWEEMGGRCDLLLTDLAMPGGMNGLQLAAELGRRQPTLRVIYTSGYRSPTQPGAELLEPGKNFLAKPYFLEELSGIIRRQFDETAS